MNQDNLTELSNFVGYVPSKKVILFDGKNPDILSDGWYFGSASDQNQIDNSSMFQTNYIEIIPGQAYYHNFYRVYVNVYDENKNFLHSSSSQTNIEENAPFIYSDNPNAKYVILIGNKNITPLEDYYCYYIAEGSSGTLDKELETKYATKEDIEPIQNLSNIIKVTEETNENPYIKEYTIRENIYYRSGDNYDSPRSNSNMNIYEITNFVPSELIAFKYLYVLSINSGLVLYELNDGSIVSPNLDYGYAAFVQIPNEIDGIYQGLIAVTSEDVKKIIIAVNNTYKDTREIICNPVMQTTTNRYELINTNAITDSELPIKPINYYFTSNYQFPRMYVSTGSNGKISVNSSKSTIITSSYMVPIIQGKKYNINVNDSTALSFTATLFNQDYTFYGKVYIAAGDTEYTAPISGFIMLLSYKEDPSIPVNSDTFYVKAPAQISLNELISSSSSGNISGLSYQDSLKAVFQNKIWVSFGDSITARGMWQSYVSDFLGLTHFNCGIGSTSLSGSSSSAYWRDTRLNAVKDNNPDIVTIFGGANDLVQNPVIGTKADIQTKTTNTFIGAYAYIIENLLAWKANLKIFIIGTSWAHRDGTQYSQDVTYGEFADACELVANYYGLPYIDLYHNSRYNMFTMDTNHIYGTDTIHPNADGGKIIANLVISKFIECMFPYYV